MYFLLQCKLPSYPSEAQKTNISLFIEIIITYKRVDKVFVNTVLITVYEKGFVTFKLIFQIISEFSWLCKIKDCKYYHF